MKNLIFLLLTLTLFTACSQSSDQPAPTEPTDKTVEVQKQSPEDYYKYFLYKESSDCGSTDLFQYIQGHAKTLREPVNGHAVLVYFYVYLKEDGTFTADYFEDEMIEEGFWPNYSTTPLHRETVSDRWSIDELGRIVLGQLGRASPITYNGDSAIELMLGTFFANKGVYGNYTHLTKISSKLGMRSDALCGRK